MKLHKAGHKPGDWEPAYEGGDHSWEDLAKMSKEQLKSKYSRNHLSVNFILIPI